METIWAAALHRDPMNTGNLKNVTALCAKCHNLFDTSHIALIPSLDSLQGAYDPKTMTAYTVQIEFPRDPQKIRQTDMSIEADDDEDPVRVRTRTLIELRTSDPARLPLPHPILL